MEVSHAAAVAEEAAAAAYAAAAVFLRGSQPGSPGLHRLLAAGREVGHLLGRAPRRIHQAELGGGAVPCRRGCARDHQRQEGAIGARIFGIAGNRPARAGALDGGAQGEMHVMRSTGGRAGSSRRKCSRSGGWRIAEGVGEIRGAPGDWPSGGGSRQAAKTGDAREGAARGAAAVGAGHLRKAQAGPQADARGSLGSGCRASCRPELRGHRRVRRLQPVLVGAGLPLEGRGACGLLLRGFGLRHLARDRQHHGDAAPAAPGPRGQVGAHSGHRRGSRRRYPTCENAAARFCLAHGGGIPVLVGRQRQLPGVLMGGACLLGVAPDLGHGSEGRVSIRHIRQLRPAEKCDCAVALA
mmetsp:Transcript_50617/g.147175  ORF Transcript_50617/g.147175 Transcript_50617/m.147175 type:complete len:354 (-) Transcript_50617:32-1093(-)